MPAKPFEQFVLPNGVRVISVHLPQSLATTVAVLVAAGSKYEPKRLNGISHFLEHMCFKGTTKRPRPIDIASELDGLGAQYNAFTSQEYTSYYAKAKNEAFDRALDIVSDLYLNPTFDPKEIEKEKGVIIEEINMYEDMPSRRIQELFMELVYGDQPAGWSVAGRKEVIRRITRGDFIKYRARHYLAQATTIVVSGGASSSQIRRGVTRQFATLRRGAKGTKPKVRERQRSPRELIHYKGTDQLHLVLGFRAFDLFDERRYPLQLLADILGGGMGSRLFQAIREDLGAAYYVNASADLYSDHGLLAMAAGVDHRKLRQVVTAGMREFRRCRDELVGRGELRRAKEHVLGNLYLSLETSDEVGYFYGSQAVMGLRLQAPQALARKIQAVSAEDIRRVARAVVRPDRTNFTLIGPYRGTSFRGILAA